MNTQAITSPITASFKSIKSKTPVSEYLEYLQQRRGLSYPYRRRLLHPRYRSKLPGRGLEIGCGLGEFLATCPRFEGIDVDPDIVAACHERGLNALTAGAYELPFPPCSFDSVLLDNVFEHLDRPADCLVQIKKILIPGGRLLIVVPNKSGYKRDTTHVNYWDENNLPQLLTAYGFEVAATAHFPIPSKRLGNLIWPYNTFEALAIKPETAEDSING